MRVSVQEVSERERQAGGRDTLGMKRMRRRMKRGDINKSVAPAKRQLLPPPLPRQAGPPRYAGLGSHFLLRGLSALDRVICHFIID